MRSLTKTQTALLARIDSDAHGTTAVLSGYRTGRKRGAFGSREHSAMIALRDAGIVRIVRRASFVDSRAAYSDHWTECVIARVESAGPEVRHATL